jgi:hypothetical protein
MDDKRRLDCGTRDEPVNRVITLVNFIELVLNRDRDEELLEGIGIHPRFL